MKKRGRFGLFLSKKGQSNEVYHVLIQVAIALAVYLILQAYIDSVSKDTLFEKVYLAKDSGFLMNSIYSAPGEINYIYKNELVELNKFAFSFKNQKASVDETESKGKLTAYQPYAEDLNAPYSCSDAGNSDSIIFSKNKNAASTSK